MGALDDNGIVGNPEDIAALAKDMGAGIPANAFKDAFLQPPELQDPDLLSQIADIVTTRHPQFADVLGNPQDVGMFLSGIGNLLNDDQRAAVAASLQDQDEIDGPINPSICLTNEEKEEWDRGRRDYINDLCGNLPMDGFRPGEEPEPLEDDLWPYPEDQSQPTLGDDWLDKVNDRERDNLDEMLDLFLNGPAALIGDALENALKQGLVNCKYDPVTGEQIEPGDDDYAAGMSIMPPMPVEIENMLDDAKKSMFQSVETRFYNDLQGKYHSFFNHLLSDSYNAPFYRGSARRPSHNTHVRHTFMSPNAADTQAQWQGKWNAVKKRKIRQRNRMQRAAPRDDEFKINIDDPFPTHVYPKTVGLWMRDQLLLEAEDMEFKTDMGLESPYRTTSVTREYTRKRWSMNKKPVTYTGIDFAQANPELELKFRDNNNGKGNGWNFGFNLKMINYLTDKQGKQLLTDGYRVVVEELETTNIPNALSFENRYGKPVAMPSKTRISRDTVLDVSIPIVPGNAAEIIDIYKSQITDDELEKYNVSGIVFKNYIKNLYNRFDIRAEHDDDLLAKDLFEQMNNFVYSSVIKFVMDHPDGASFTMPGYTTIDSNGDDLEVAPVDYSGVPEAFMFGYVNDNLSKADLTYVKPSATSDKDTWEYDFRNKDKILGRSATKHKRVEFLDPELHDMGKYTRPKIYIKPPDYTGWLAVNQLVIPEEDNHEPARKSFLFIDELTDKEKKLKDEIPMDERLTDPHACQQEGPYDVFSDPGGHAGTHVSVLAMARVYAFEHMLKSMALYQIAKPDFKKNFDESILAAIVEDMEEDLADLPRRRSKKGFFKGYNFWLLFLEQSAQTAERMIITGDLEPNGNISAALEAVNKVREEYTPLTKKWIKLFKHVRTVTWDGAGGISNVEFAYSRKIKGERKYYPMEIDMSEEDLTVIKTYIDSVMFYSLGRSFRSILAGETRNFAYRMRRRQKRLFKMSYKLYAIHKSKEVAKILLRYIVASQLDYYGDKLQEIGNDRERAGPKPKYYIDNIRKYFFGSSNTLMTPLKGGSKAEEDAFQDLLKEAAENGDPRPTFDYGLNAKHVVHNPRIENPVDSMPEEEFRRILDAPFGNFYFEKYIRVVDKPDGHISETDWFRQNQKSILTDRDELLKGVVNIPEFQKFLKENMDTLGAVSHDFLAGEEGEVIPHAYHTKISNIFGDAVPVYPDPDPESTADTTADDGDEEQPPPEKIGYDGSTGIRFGVRLCWIPPASYDPPLFYSDTIPQKSFLFNDMAARPGSTAVLAGAGQMYNYRKIMPLVSYEQDVMDRAIVQLDLEDENFGEDVSCCIKELMNTPEMSLVFDYVAPIRRASSMLSLYTHYGFVPSIAEHGGERDTENGDAPTEYWKSVILSQTKNSLRSLFIANYSSVIFLSEKAGSKKDGFKINFPKLWKRLFKILINPFAFLAGLSVSWGGWKKGRQIVDRPYDMYGEVEGSDDGVE